MGNDELRRAKWEQQFRQGVWDVLKSVAEVPRYGAIGAYLRQLDRPISLLDVGCGEGLILKFCDRAWLRSYSGLDISQEALNKITTLLPGDSLMCSSVEEFCTEQRFDVILFNEVLYYTADPYGQLVKFRNYLNPGGLFLISTFKGLGLLTRNGRNLRLVWRLISDCKWNVIDDVVIKNISRGLSWRIALIQPGDDGACENGK